MLQGKRHNRRCATVCVFAVAKSNEIHVSLFRDVIYVFQKFIKRTIFFVDRFGMWFGPYAYVKCQGKNSEAKMEHWQSLRLCCVLYVIMIYFYTAKKVPAMALMNPNDMAPSDLLFRSVRCIANLWSDWDILRRGLGKLWVATPETEVFSSRGKQPVHGKSTSQRVPVKIKMGFACLEGMVLGFSTFFGAVCNEDSTNASDHAGVLHRPCRMVAYSIWMDLFI
jgi:hypothetical protein